MVGLFIFKPTNFLNPTTFVSSSIEIFFWHRLFIFARGNEGEGVVFQGANLHLDKDQRRRAHQRRFMEGWE